jgi:hypothetical protein
VLLAGTPDLADVDGVTTRWLAEPDAAEAVEMFAAAGESATLARSQRGDARNDPAVREIGQLCGRQPRAVRALGYRAARHGWRYGDLLATLRRAATAPPYQPLPYLPVLTMLTGVDVAYGALPVPARRLFRLLSLAPGPLDRAAIAVVCRWRPERVSRMLDLMADGAFVRAAPPDRYEVRPLLAAYARLHLRREEPRRRAVRAYVRLLRHLARQAERHVVNLTAPGGDAERIPLPFRAHPAEWFTQHEEVLLGLVNQVAEGGGRPPVRVRTWWWRLAVALCGWYAHEGRLDEWAAVCHAALALPAGGQRPEIGGWAHNELGVLRRRRGDAPGAVAQLRLAVAARGRRGTAQARTNLGLALLDLGQVDEAIDQLELARRHRSHGDRAGQALTDLALGAAHLIRGAAEPAHHHLVRAANTFRAVGDQRGDAAALSNLVLAQWQLGEHLDAAQSWAASLAEYDSLNDPDGRAAALLNAGAALIASAPERAEQAYELLREGRRLRELRQPTAGLARTLLHLGDAAALLGRPTEARAHWTDAVGIGEAVGDATATAAGTERLSGNGGPQVSGVPQGQ